MDILKMISGLIYLDSLIEKEDVAIDSIMAEKGQQSNSDLTLCWICLFAETNSAHSAYIIFDPQGLLFVFNPKICNIQPKSDILLPWGE